MALYSSAWMSGISQRVIEMTMNGNKKISRRRRKKKERKNDHGRNKWMKNKTMMKMKILSNKMTQLMKNTTEEEEQQSRRRRRYNTWMRSQLALTTYPLKFCTRNKIYLIIYIIKQSLPFILTYFTESPLLPPQSLSILSLYCIMLAKSSWWRQNLCGTLTYDEPYVVISKVTRHETCQRPEIKETHRHITTSPPTVPCTPFPLPSLNVYSVIPKVYSINTKREKKTRHYVVSIIFSPIHYLFYCWWMLDMFQSSTHK